MKPILWVDAQILKFFTKMAKDFNWLTGKNNYFLAKVCVVIIALLSIFAGYKHNWFIFVTGLFLLCPMMWNIISTSKSIVEKEQELGIKILSKHYADRQFRLCYLFLVVLAIIVFGLGRTALTVTMLCAVSYLISIDKPPFKKSQAWQKIKSWFNSGLTQPQVETIPVRSN